MITTRWPWNLLARLALGRTLGQEEQISNLIAFLAAIDASPLAAALGLGTSDVTITRVVGVEASQVLDLPPIALEVTQHDLVSRRCSCGTVTKAERPGRGERAGVMLVRARRSVSPELRHSQVHVALA